MGKSLQRCYLHSCLIESINTRKLKHHRLVIWLDIAVRYLWSHGGFLDVLTPHFLSLRMSQVTWNPGPENEKRLTGTSSCAITDRTLA